MFVKVNYQTASKDGTTKERPYITKATNFITDHNRILKEYACGLCRWTLVHITPTKKKFEYHLKSIAGYFILFGKTEPIEAEEIPDNITLECENKAKIYHPCNFTTTNKSLLGLNCQCGGEIIAYINE